MHSWPCDGVKYEYIFRKKPITHHNIIHTIKYTINIDIINLLYMSLPLPIYEEVIDNFVPWG